MKTASAWATPKLRSVGTEESAKTRKTAIMISAAPVITGAVLTRPFAIAADEEPVRRYSSRIRAKRKTS